MYTYVFMSACHVLCNMREAVCKPLPSYHRKLMSCHWSPSFVILHYIYKSEYLVITIHVPNIYIPIFLGVSSSGISDFVVAMFFVLALAWWCCCNRFHQPTNGARLHPSSLLPPGGPQPDYSSSPWGDGAINLQECAWLWFPWTRDCRRKEEQHSPPYKSCETTGYWLRGPLGPTWPSPSSYQHTPHRLPALGRIEGEVGGEWGRVELEMKFSQSRRLRGCAWLNVTCEENFKQQL